MISTEALLLAAAVGIITTTSAATYYVHENLIGFNGDPQAQSKKIRASYSNYEDSSYEVARFDISQAAYKCEQVVKESVKSKIYSIYYDDNSSYLNESSNQYQIYYRLEMAGGQSGFYRSDKKLRATFACHISARTNKLVKRDIFNYSSY